jgi:PAS domain S-box-containing protein
MCELKGSVAAHIKRRHLAISVGLVIFAFLTAACGSLTRLSSTEATPQPADGTQTTVHETTGSTRPQPDLPQDPKFTHITIEQGLSDQVVLAVLQDSAGFMWFGTINGLNRYDGYNIVEYRNDPADPHSLSNNSVEDLYEDRFGTLWVATRSGLNAFDRRTERFTRYLHDPENPDSLSNETVLMIYEDQSGALWIATLDGLNRFDHATGTFTAYHHDPDNPNTLSNSSIRAIHEDQSGVLWVGTIDGLNRFDRATGTFTAYRHDPEDPQSLSHSSIYGVYSDHSGALWIATDGGGINRFDQTTGNFTTYRHDPNEPNSLGNDQVDGFFEDATGALWVSTFGGGVSVIDPDRETVTTLRHASDNPASLSHDTVSDMTADRSGSIWLATQGGGVDVYSPWQQAFTNYQRDNDVANSLASDTVWSVYEDREGVLWIGTRDQGLDRFDRRSGQIDHYPPDPQNPYSLGHPFVLSIVQDPASALWVGTFGGGLYRLDEASGSFSAFRHDPTDPQSLSGDIIPDLFVDASGQLWIATTSGLSLYDQNSSTFTSYRHDPDNPQSLSQDVIMKIAEDRHGDLWLATFSGGLNRMEPDTGQVMRYLHDPEDPASLGSNILTDLHIDRSGVLWIGTASEGLDRLNPGGDSFTHYREDDGLVSDRIVSILEDGDADDPAAGNLWIATGKGLSKFDRDRKTFRSYGVSDGLPLAEFHRDNHKTQSGELLIGSTNGVIAFDPADLMDDTYIPPVVFTDFLLAYEPVKIGSDSPLQQTIDLTDMIELTYADQTISIEFAALSYTAPSQNRYRYRLDSFEEDWIEVDSTRRLVTYTNLDPGRYVFHVTGSNGDAVWNEVGREITLVITPPWWETWWFRGGVLLLTVGLVAGGFVWQRQSSRRREHQLAALVQERTADLQDEIEQRERAEIELMASREEYRDLVENINEVIYTFDESYVVTYVSPAIESLLGYPPEQVIGQPFAKFIHPDDLDGARDNIQKVMSGVSSGFNEYRIMNTSGEILWVRASSTPIMDEDRITGFRGVLTDISAIKRAEGHIERAAALAERQRLARELHDSVTQTLYGIDLFSNAAERELKLSKNEPAMENVKQIKELSHAALGDMRLLIFELQPQILEEEGLASALKERLDLVEGRSGLSTSIRVVDERPIDISIEAELYAITTEALNNTLKHSRAEHVGVVLEYRKDSVCLMVQDDGIGYDYKNPGVTKGFGMRNMEERAFRISGSFSLDSSPEAGTTIKVEVAA